MKTITAVAIVGFILLSVGQCPAVASPVTCVDYITSGYCPTPEGLVCYRDIRNCRYYYPRTNRISKRVLNRHSPSQSLREEVKRSVMNGSESRLAAMNYIDADCTPGPVPVVRIVTPPKNGEFRMEEVSIPLNRPAGNARAKCNGTPVQAVGVYYKAKAEYTGDDAMVIDVDFKHGYIKRFVYAISVR